MAFIPDEAIERSGEISNAAFRLYCYYCKKRNRETGNYSCPGAATAAELGMNRTQVYNVRAELIASKWISVEGEIVTPLMGKFTLSAASVEVVTHSDNLSKVVTYNDRSVTHSDKVVTHSDNPLEPPNRNTSPPAHQHSASAHNGNGKATSSRFSLETCLAYAQSLPTIHSPPAFARRILRDGSADGEIAAWVAATEKANKPPRKFCGKCKQGYVIADPKNPNGGRKRCECNQAAN